MCACPAMCLILMESSEVCVQILFSLVVISLVISVCLPFVPSTVFAIFPPGSIALTLLFSFPSPILWIPIPPPFHGTYFSELFRIFLFTFFLAHFYFLELFFLYCGKETSQKSSSLTTCTCC